MKLDYGMTLTYGDVYCQVRSGDMSEEEFKEWCTDNHHVSWDEGYQEGVSNQ